MRSLRGALFLPYQAYDHHEGRRRADQHRPGEKAEKAAYEKKRASDQAMEMEMMKKTPMPGNK